MKKICNYIKYGLLLCVALCAFVFVSGITARATESDLSVSITFDSPYLYEYNGNYYFSGDENSSDVTAKYVIKNLSSDTVKLSAVRIVETLSGEEESLYGNTVYDEMMTIAPGAQLELSGNLFFFDDSDDFVFQYDVYVVYTQEDEFGISLSYDENDFQSILSDTDIGMMYITKEKIDFDAEYSFSQSGENVYVGDTAVLGVKLTLNGNVPVKNVKIYDSVYGLIGQTELIQQNETAELTAEIAVRSSTQSYLYIEYTTVDGSRVDKKVEFTSATVDIEVSKHSYNLVMEIQCDNIYISKNQSVEIKFVVTNVGSGTINDITVIDEDGNTVFTILTLGKNEICEESVTLKFSPGNTYVYSCISPLTTETQAEISFLSLPGLNLSYSFDKDIADYRYLDKVVVTYTVENKGSVMAKDIVISDCGQIYTLGTINEGQKRTFVMTFTLTSEETAFKPVLTGSYDDGSPIEESGIETTVYVELPASYVDIDFSYEISPEIVHEGDTVTITYTLKNTGTGALTSYSVLIVEKNMVVASEGVLQPGESKSFSMNLVMDYSQTVTFKVSGKYGDDGSVYEKNTPVKIDVVPSETLSPTPTEPTPTPSASVNGGNVEPSDDDDNFKIALMLIFAIGIVSIIMIVVTAVVVLKKTLGKKR